MQTIRIAHTGARPQLLALPSEWKEIPPQAWETVCTCLALNKPFAREAIAAMATRPDGRQLESELVASWPSEVIGALYNSLQWLSSPLMIPPVAQFEHAGQVWHLPGEKFRGMAIIEFAFLDMAFQVIYAYRKQPEQVAEWQARTIAYLARPADPDKNPNDPRSWDGDTRERFNSGISEGRIELFKSLPTWLAYGILHYVRGCKEAIHAQYQEIWPKPKEHKPDAKPPKLRPREWIDTCRRLAGGKFGDLESTYYTNLYLVLDELKEQAISQRKREREARLQRAKNKKLRR